MPLLTLPIHLPYPVRTQWAELPLLRMAADRDLITRKPGPALIILTVIEPTGQTGHLARPLYGVHRIIHYLWVLPA